MTCFLLASPVLSHAPADTYLLTWWYLVVVLVSLIYLVLSNSPFKQRVTVVGSAAIAAIFAIFTLGAVSAPINTGKSYAISLIIGIAPLAGAFIGVIIAKSINET
jgi:hypothetical protein